MYGVYIYIYMYMINIPFKNILWIKSHQGHLIVILRYVVFKLILQCIEIVPSGKIIFEFHN